MPLEIVYRRDITKINCDAIVNAANSSLLGGSGVDGAIHAAAGPELLEECRTLGGCETGNAKITRGYGLPCRFVIHAVGPVWTDGRHGEEQLLRSAYRKSLELAELNGCESVAFPLISAGAFGYPKSEAYSVAVDEIGRYLRTSDLKVVLTVFFRPDELILEGRFAEMRRRLDHDMPAYASGMSCDYAPAPARRLKRDRAKKTAPPQLSFVTAESSQDTLKERLETIDESFSQMLLRKIDELGITDAECYRRANVDRKHFSKIRCSVQYKPSKATALAFAIALKLPLKETDELLMKAGFALSNSSMFDIIVGYYIENGVYDVYKINETLFTYDQPLLGA